MKAIFILLLTVCLVIEFASSTNAQTSYKDMSDHFIATWEAKASDWSGTENWQIIVYVISATLTLLSAGLQAIKKGGTAIAIGLTVLVGLSAQVSWLFNIQPKKYAWASKMVQNDLDNFKYSLYGQDLSNPEISASYLEQQQKLEQKFQKIALWLIGDQSETSPPTITTELRGKERLSASLVSFKPDYAMQGDQCLEPQYNFALSNAIKSGSYTINIPTSLRDRINTDESSVYAVGMSISSDAKTASLGASECARAAITRFLVKNGAGNAASNSIAEEVSSGIIGQSEVVFLKFFERAAQNGCLKIYRISKASLSSYYLNANSLKMKDPQRTNKEFKEKLIKVKSIKD